MRARHDGTGSIRWIGRWSVRLGLACAAALALVLPTSGATAAAPPAAEEVTQAAAPTSTRIDLLGPWKFKGDWEENGLAEGWQGPDFDDSEWRSLHVPASWEEQGILTSNPRWPRDPERTSAEGDDGYNGYAWYRRHFTVPADWGRAKVRFRSGEIHDMEWTYVNGRLIGSTIADEPWTQSRDYLIPPDVLKVGEDNVIAIRICDLGGAGGILEGPVELVNTSALEAEEGEERTALESRYPGRQRELVNIGGGVDVPATMMVDGDAVAIGGPVDVRGYVRGSVVAIGGNIHAYAGSRIDGDAVSIGGSVIREGDTHIGGSVVQGPFLPGGLVSRIVTAAVGQKERRMPEPWPFGRLGFLGRAGSFFSSLLLWAIVTGLAVLLFPRRLEVMARALPEAPGRAAAFGIGGFFVTSAGAATLVLVGIALCVILAMTVIGIPLIPVVGIGMFAAIVFLPLLALLGTVAVWLSLGRAAAARTGLPELHAIWAALLGLLLIAVATLIPGIGALIVVTVLIFGFGAALMTGVGANAKWVQRRFGAGREMESTREEGEARTDETSAQ